MQVDLRNAKTKSKSKTAATSQLEKLLEERQKMILQHEDTIHSLKKAIDDKDALVTKRETTIEELEKKMTESKNVLDTNEHGI